MTALKSARNEALTNPIQQSLVRIAEQIRAIRETRETSQPSIESDGDFFSFRNQFVHSEIANKAPAQYAKVSQTALEQQARQLQGALNEALERIEKLRASSADENEYNTVVKRIYDQNQDLFKILSRLQQGNKVEIK